MKSDKELFEEFKNQISISNFKQDYSPEEIKNRRKYDMKKRIIAISSIACCALISTVVFAFNGDKIINHFKGKNERGLGKGIDTAIENGYIEDPDMEYNKSITKTEVNKKIIDNVEVETKISDFIMDDYNISTKFELKFDSKIFENINDNGLYHIEFPNLIVVDENNNILYRGIDEIRFYNFCSENNLLEQKDEYYNCGLNSFISKIDKISNTINITYNMYCDSSKAFPKSKKLTFYFNKIELTDKNDENNIISVEGSWNYSVDVPENMYNRSSINYEATNTSNPNFELVSAKVTETGFEFNVIISNIEEPEMLSREFLNKVDTLNEDYESGKISKEEAEEIKLVYMEWFNLRRPIKIGNAFTDKPNSYVENSSGKKFECTMSPSRKAHSLFMEDKKFDFYETFGMTKYDATDNIKLVLYYYGEPVTIQLEKIK